MQARLATVLTCVLSVSGPCARAATYYVSTAGNDGNPGTQSVPFRHLSKGAAAATQPGDTVIVMDGTYDNEGQVAPDYVVTLYYAGTSGHPITFQAQHRGMAILDSMNTSTTETCNGAYSYFNLYNASFIVIQGFVIQRGCYEGIHSNDSAHDIVITQNVIQYIGNHDNTTQIGEDGIYLNNSEYNFTFDSNTFHDIGRTSGQAQLHFDHGIYTHTDNAAVINNIFYNMNAGWSILLADGASNVLIANNTFAFPNTGDGETGHVLWWGTNTNITVRNNIFYNPNTAAMTRDNSTISGCVFDHNLVYPVSSVMKSSFPCSVTSNVLGSGNPNFVNASTSSPNFYTQSNGAGVDTGVNLSQVPYDYAGTTRPQGSSTDMGAYEYISSGGSAPPVISGIFTSSVTANSAVINWTTDQNANSYVNYGSSSNYGSQSPVNSNMVTIHSVALSNLSASTTYHFQAGSTNSSSQTTLSSDSTFTTPSAAPPGVNAATFVSQTAPPSTVTPGQSYQVSVTMSNTGTTTWTAAGNYRLGSQNPQDNTTWGTARIPLNSSDSIAPGQSKAFTFVVTAPATAGSYAFQWRMVQEPGQWFGNNTPSVTVGVQGNGPGVNAATFVSQRAPPFTLTPGQKYEVSVTMTNTGTTTWTAAGNYKLGSQTPQDNTTWGTARILLNSSDSIAPGQSKAFTFVVTAPATAGSYAFQWRMVQEPGQWFGDYTPSVTVGVQGNGPVNAATFVSQTAPPSTVTPGQSYQVSVTMSNTGTTTWTAAGNYRLGSQNPQDNTTWGTARILLNSSDSIAPGQSKAFTFVVTAPATAGSYAFQWRMVQEPGQWFGDYTPSVTVGVQGNGPGVNAATFVSQTAPPSTVTPGRKYEVSVTMNNTGTTTWTAAGNYGLGSQNPQDNITWGVGRVYLNPGDSIAPGQSKTFTFVVTTPATTGSYVFQWRMVQELVQWFGAYTPGVTIGVQR